MKLLRRRTADVTAGAVARVVAKWQCPNCDHAVSSPFCPACGERPLAAGDLTLKGLLKQLAQACTNIDGPLLSSFRSLVTTPGVPTMAYLAGRRKPYTLPLPLFLVTNVLFFGMQSLTGAKVFSTPLDQHLHSDIWGGFAEKLVASHLAARRTTLALYTPVFDQAVALNAKSLIVLMVLPFAGFAAALFYPSHRPFATHVVFSLHFYSFLLLLLSVSLIVVGVEQLFGGRGLQSENFDHALSIIELLACATYLSLATGSVYSARRFQRIVKAVALTVAAAVIFLGYRFVIFLITLYGT